MSTIFSRHYILFVILSIIIIGLFIASFEEKHENTTGIDRDDVNIVSKIGDQSLAKATKIYINATSSAS